MPQRPAIVGSPLMEFEVDSDITAYVDEGDVLTATIKAVKKSNDREVLFTFTLDDQYQTLIHGSTTTRFNTQTECRLRRWAEAALGTDLKIGDVLISDDLIGRRCRVVVGLQEVSEVDQTIQQAYVKQVLPPDELSTIAG